MQPGEMLPETNALGGQDATPQERARMTRLYGSKWAACPCGRKFVLMYKRAEKWPEDFVSNDATSDRFTYHDTPIGIACPHGGELLIRVPGAAVQS